MLPSVGVVVSGNSSRTLLPVMRAAGFEIGGVWGPTKQQAKELAQEFNIAFYTSKIDELLLREDVDLVCILCPPYLRAEVAVKALSIGKHVLCEAPAGIGREEAERMVGAAQYYPKLLSLMKHELRLLPAFIKMKQLIADGFCGELRICECKVELGTMLGQQYDWLCDHIMGGGVLTNYGCHVIDLMSFLTNERALEVHGTLKTFVTETESIPQFRHITADDFCAFQMKLGNNIFCTATLNTHIPGKYSQVVTVVGSKARLVVKNDRLFAAKSGFDEEEIILHDYRKDSLRMKARAKDSTDMYLTGTKAWVGAIKRAFEESVDKEDRRSADLQAIQSAASFDDGEGLFTVIDFFTMYKMYFLGGGGVKANALVIGFPGD